MEQVGGSITHSDTNGSIIEDILFTYSDEEREENKINAETAKLVFCPEFIPYRINFKKRFNLSHLETLLYGFIRFYKTDSTGRFYFTNKQLATMMDVSESSIEVAIPRLTALGLIKCGHKIKAGGGRVRFVNSVLLSFCGSEPQKTKADDPSKLRDNKNKIKENKINTNTPPIVPRGGTCESEQSSFLPPANEDAIDTPPPSQLGKKEKSCAKRERKRASPAPQGEGYMTEEDFRNFYKAYPRRKQRPSAERAFYSIERRHLPQIMSTLEAQKKADWREDIARKFLKHIPYPATWLNADEWNDEVVIPVSEQEAMLAIATKSPALLTDEEVLTFSRTVGWEPLMLKMAKLPEYQDTMTRFKKLLIANGIDQNIAGRYFDECKRAAYRHACKITLQNIKREMCAAMTKYGFSVDTLPQRIKDGYEEKMRSNKVPSDPDEDWYDFSDLTP